MDLVFRCFGNMVLLLDPLSCCCEINTNNVSTPPLKDHKTSKLRVTALYYFHLKLQLLILYTILTTLPQPSLQLPAVNRRSALEGGHVSFPEKPRILRPFPTLSTSSTLAPTSQTLKLTSVVPVNSKEKIQTVKPLSVAISTTVATGHIRREWIPGRTRWMSKISKGKSDLELWLQVERGWVVKPSDYTINF